MLGKRFGKRFGHFRQLIANLTLAEIQLLEEQGAITLDGEVFNRDDILLYRNAREGMPVTCGAAIAIVLDTELDEALMQEGMAREVVNEYKTRKDMDLQVDARIHIAFEASDVLADVIGAHQAYIQQETLAQVIERHTGLSEQDYTHVIDAHDLRLRIEVVQ